MFERVLVALRTRTRLRIDDLTTAPPLRFCVRFVSDFEGIKKLRWMVATCYYRIGGRPHLWRCTTPLLAGSPRPMGRSGSTIARLSGDVVLQFGAAHVQFGRDPQTQQPTIQLASQCRKNIEMEPCTLDFVRSIALGKQITSAGDFGGYLEVGLEQRYNLGLMSRVSPHSQRRVRLKITVFRILR